VTWPEPLPGLVIRYSYLWDREAHAGREEGGKDRPCAIVLVRRDIQGRQRVMVLPITHTRPTGPDEAIEIPRAVKRHLGMDTERSWIVMTEVNAFNWPGPDLRFLPGRGPESAVYGFLPPALFRSIRDRLLTLWQERHVKIVPRSE
jgi:hypothetical protein